MDSYYGGLELAQILQEKDLYFLLSCAKNRPNWLFKDYLNKNLKVKNFAIFLIKLERRNQIMHL